MNFKEKLRGAFFKIRVRLVWGGVLALMLIIGACAPISIAIHDARTRDIDKTYKGALPNINSEILIEDLGEYIASPKKALSKCFTPEYFGTFFKSVRIVIYLYILFASIGFFKAIPKHEFDDIEHGSSKWSEGGEQYAILSRKKGIILAEKNYLPVDKRGNVNVLVVRRFWCW